MPTQFENFLPCYVPAHIVSKAILNIIKPFETVLSPEKNYQLLWPHVKIFSTTLTPRKKYDVCGTTSYPSTRKKSQGAWDSQQRSKCKKKVEQNRPHKIKMVSFRIEKVLLQLPAAFFPTKKNYQSPQKPETWCPHYKYDREEKILGND